MSTVRNGSKMINGLLVIGQPYRLEASATNLSGPKFLHITNPTPRPGDIQIGQYTIQGPLDRGSDGVVLSGVNRQTGEAVAVKRVQRTPADMDRIRLEEHITKDIGVHVSFPCTMNLY
jgi:hypothetical protein